MLRMGKTPYQLFRLYYILGISGQNQKLRCQRRTGHGVHATKPEKAVDHKDCERQKRPTSAVTTT